jgi:hypothetical protein
MTTSVQSFKLLKYAALTVLSFSSVAGYSQHSIIKKDKLSMTLELGLPSIRGNKALREYLNGLVNIQPKLQYKFSPELFFSFGPKYSYFGVDNFNIPTKTNGGAHTYGGFMEIGWTKWQSRRLAIECGIKFGVSHTVFATGINRSSGIQRVTAPYAEPTFSLILAADEAIAYRWIIGYNITGYRFQPSDLGLVTNGGFKPNELRAPAQFLLIGFGMSYYFSNKRTDQYIDTNLDLDLTN